MRSSLHSKRQGFSLIEVALALLVVSVGLIAAVGLLPGSLDNSKKASDDTQQSLLADYILNSIRAYATTTNLYTWSTFVNSPANIKMPVAAINMWDAGQDLVIRADGTTRTLIFKAESDTRIEEMTLAYNLKLEPDTSTNPSLVKATLMTWVNTPQNTNSLKTYQAVIYRGDLPP